MAGKSTKDGEDVATTCANNGRAMRIRLSSPDLLNELLKFFRAEPSAVVEQLSDDEVEVSLLGSYQGDALRMQLYLRLRA